ncbi:MAG: T9SS type A sorting domain-containing protein [Muribaculaceae bacterium]|nr:T9SS type A sorting domain-containing protein [Muribaculaceae bacterium]
MGYEKSTHTGLETAKADSDVRIGKDCISVNCASDGAQQFAIFDTDGRTVSAKEFTGHFSFDLNTLATGTYILKIGTMQPVKFVVK